MGFFNFLKRKNKTNTTKTKNNQAQFFDDHIPYKNNNTNATKTQSKLTPCKNNNHNFIEVDLYTGGIIYKCDKCGLEVNSPSLSTAIFKDFFGSYIAGFSHKWDTDNMSADDIVQFSISFDNSPMTYVKYDGSHLIIQNSDFAIKDKPDSFPKGFLNEKAIPLNEQNSIKLKNFLKTIDFNSFVTSPDFFSNFSTPDFCRYERFICCFSNGKSFECFSPKCSDFTKLVSFIKELTKEHTELIHKSNPIINKSKITHKTTTGIILPCCDKAVPVLSLYCPYCGKLIEDKTKQCDVIYDAQETLLLCSNCGFGNKFEYRFCIHCGKETLL